MCMIGNYVRKIKVPENRPLTAYRAWLPGLRPVYKSRRWKGVGEVTLANETPAKKNSSGLYGFKNEALFLYHMGYDFGSRISSDFNPAIHGIVEMWGTVIEHEDGYRASHARIVQIVRGKTKTRLKV